MWQEKNNALNKQFSFDNFQLAVDFVNKVAELAQKLDHHPKIINEYDKVTIELTTHSASGITDKDHEMSREIDKLINQPIAKPKSAEEVKLFTDGGSRGNPGHSAIGYAIYDKDDNLLERDGKYLGITTNNQAEYNGLKIGLLAVQQMGVKNIEVYMDSLLVVNQLKGEYKVKNQDLVPIFRKVKSIASQFESIEYTHVPRALNKVADTIVNDVLDSRE